MMITPYAVLLKTHYWDSFMDRQLSRIKAQSRSGIIYIVFDKSNRAMPPIPHSNVIGIDDDDLRNMGLTWPKEYKSALWYNVDYPLYRLISVLIPGYDYYVSYEHDVVSNIDLDRFVQHARDKAVDYVGHPIGTPFASWYWRFSIEGVYPDSFTLYNWLSCFALHSSRSAWFLFERRRRLTEQYKAGEIKVWPNNEPFISTEMHNNGFKTMKLSEFGKTERYNWWPPTIESDLPALKDQAFIHPLLPEGPYVASCLRYSIPRNYFYAGSQVRKLLDRASPRVVFDALTKEYLSAGDNESCKRLRRLMLSSDGGGPRKPDDTAFAGAQQGMTAESQQDSTREQRVNIALRKPATQSSTCRWSASSSREEDAAGAVTGKLTGRHGFHTDMEDEPWWSVDLGEKSRIAEIVLYNRLDFAHIAARANHLAILISDDGEGWERIYQYDADKPFGGVDGYPLRVRLDPPVFARYVRVQLTRRNCLHLDGVEIFAEAAAAD